MFLKKSMKSTGWKQKIDPLFDEAIKTYVSHLEHLENLPKNGQFSIIDELQTASEHANWHSGYLKDLRERKFAGFAKEVGIFDDNFYSLINFPELKDLENYLENCIKAVQKLPAQSARFYTEQIETILKRSPDSDENIQKAYNDLLQIIILLIVRFLFINLSKMTNPINEDVIASITKYNILDLLIASIHQQMSLLSNKQTIGELLKQGDDTSLLKAITIDKNILNFEPLKNRILKAQITGDTKFLEKLSKAISKRPLTKIAQHGKTYAVLKFFWPVLYPILNAEEIHSLLEASGLIPPPFPDGFYKFIQRHINPSFRPKSL